MNHKDLVRIIASIVGVGILLYVLGIALASMTAAQTNSNYRILRVIDGDTVEIEAPFIPDPLEKKLSVRVLGIDTPESKHRAKCAKERAMAQQALQVTTREIRNAKIVKVEFVKWDKYGGRILGNIVVDNVSLSRKLIEAGLAVEYDGKGPKKDWCL